MPDSSFLSDRQKHYAAVLNDLFDPTPQMNTIRIFEFVCALVRAGGLELGGIDPWYESKAIIDDMRNLSQLDLPPERFSEPLKTRIRLARWRTARSRRWTSLTSSSRISCDYET